MPIVIPAALALALKIATVVGAGYSIDQLSGNRFSNFFGPKGGFFGGFKSNYDYDMDEYNKSKNQSTRTRARGSFFNFNRKNQTTGQTRRDGILSFLGDRSRKLDDAPDIVEKNESVLSGIRTFGANGLLPQSNIVPNVSNERISDPSYEGVRKEIDKINRNIEAISSAMLQGALLDKDYRDQVIDDMRKDLVEKGKDRSKTRTERSIFNLLTRPKKRFNETAKSLSKGMSAAFGIGLGAAELFGLGEDFFGEGGEEKENKKEDNDDDDGTPPGSSNNKPPTVGDYYFKMDGRGGKYFILQSNGVFRKTNVRPKTGRQFKRDDFSDIIESLKNNQNNNLEGGSSDDNDTNKDLSYLFNLGEGNNTFEGSSTFNDNSLITTLMSDDYKPLGDKSRTNIFDLRKNIKKGEDMTGAGQQVAGSGLETEIVTLAPEVGPSIWESFSRSIG